MALGSISPTPKYTAFDNNGDPLIGGKLYVYTAGTTTLATTYTDTDLLVPNTNPIILDSGGRATIFLAAGSYKFVQNTATDAAVWSQDNITQVPRLSTATNVTVDVPGTAGEALAAGAAVYLSVGLGGKTAGRWYNGSTANAYSSSGAQAVAMAPVAVASGALGVFRVQGITTVTGPLVAGTAYYISAVAGVLTAVKPTSTFVRLMGVADTTTSLVSVPSLGPAPQVDGPLWVSGGAAEPILYLNSTTAGSASVQFLANGNLTPVAAITSNGTGFLSLTSTFGTLLAANTATGNVQFGQHISVSSTKRLYLDGSAFTGDTYITESSANVLDLVSGGITTSLTSGVLTVNGFGSHAFSAGGTGGNAIGIRNTTAGTGNYAWMYLGNDADATVTRLWAFSTTYTTSGPYLQNASLLEGIRAGGLNIAATHASGVLRFYAGGTTVALTISAVGAPTFNAGTASGYLYATSAAKLFAHSSATRNTLFSGTTDFAIDNQAGTIDLLTLTNAGDLTLTSASNTSFYIKAANTGSYGQILYLQGATTAWNVYANAVATPSMIWASGGAGTVRMDLSAAGVLSLPAYTATTYAAGDFYLVVNAAGVIHRSAIGPGS